MPIAPHIYPEAYPVLLTGWGEDGSHPFHLWEFLGGLRLTSEKGLTHLNHTCLGSRAVGCSLQSESCVIFRYPVLLRCLKKRSERINFPQHCVKSPCSVWK